MNREYPLVNPTIDDYESSSENEEVSDEIPVLKGQIGLDLEVDRSQQLLSATKMILKNRAETMEVYSLWRNPAMPFAFTTTILNIVVLLIGGILTFNNLPTRVPVFYNSINNHWDQFDKSIVIIFPTGLFILGLFILNLSIRIYRYDRRLSIAMAWIMAFINVLLLIAMGQIYTLIT